MQGPVETLSRMAGEGAGFTFHIDLQALSSLTVLVPGHVVCLDFDLDDGVVRLSWVNRH